MSDKPLFTIGADGVDTEALVNQIRAAVEEKKRQGAPEEEAGGDKKKLRAGRSKDSRMGNIIDILK